MLSHAKEAPGSAAPDGVTADETITPGRHSAMSRSHPPVARTSSLGRAVYCTTNKTLDAGCSGRLCPRTTRSSGAPAATPCLTPAKSGRLAQVHVLLPSGSQSSTTLFPQLPERTSSPNNPKHNRVCPTFKPKPPVQQNPLLADVKHPCVAAALAGPADTNKRGMILIQTTLAVAACVCRANNVYESCNCQPCNLQHKASSIKLALPNRANTSNCQTNVRKFRKAPRFPRTASMRLSVHTAKMT